MELSRILAYTPACWILDTVSGGLHQRSWSAALCCYVTQSNCYKCVTLWTFFIMHPLNEWMDTGMEGLTDEHMIKWFLEVIERQSSPSRPLFWIKATRKGAVARLLWGIRADSSSLVQHQFTTALHCTGLKVWPVALKEVTGVLRKTWITVS